MYALVDPLDLENKKLNKQKIIPRYDCDVKNTFQKQGQFCPFTEAVLHSLLSFQNWAERILAVGPIKPNLSYPSDRESKLWKDFGSPHFLSSPQSISPLSLEPDIP